MRAPRRRRGFSLVELAIGMSLLAIVVAIPALTMSSSMRAQDTSSKVAELNTNGRRVLDDVAARLRLSGTATIPQSDAGPTEPFSTIDFSLAEGWTGDGDVDWGPPERILLESDPSDPEDGIDNDSDGLVDEKRVVWIHDVGGAEERTLVLCSRVRRALAGEVPGNGVDDNDNDLVDEEGLTFVFDGDRAQVLLTLEDRAGDGTLVTKTFRKTIALRN